MTKKYILVFVLLALFAGSMNAQLNQSFTEKDLRISWKLITNNFRNEPMNQASITLTNTGKEVFPSTGWTIFFNYNRSIFPEFTSGPFVLSHVNGDIFQCRSTGRVKDLNPGDSISITFVSDGFVLNYTSAPIGFYLVWDNEPTKGLSLSNYKMFPIQDTSVHFLTPEDTYRKNITIRDIPLENLPLVFPCPVKEIKGNGEFLLDAKVQIVTDPKFINEAEYLSESLSRFIKKPLEIVTSAITEKSIQFNYISLPEEAYILDIQTDKIQISASSGAGIFYGIQSLKSAITVSAFEKTQKSISIPLVHIEDEPRFAYRGFMLDVARNFQAKSELLKLIDLMSMYKLNTLHLHFSDDEGWRIEIPSLPELTEVGSRRGHTTDSYEFLSASYGSGPDPGKLPASGYYSKSDFIEILKYANERHICVIPEIESPGHARAAIKAMNKRYRHFMALGNKAEAERYLLREQDDESVHSSAQLWTDNIMCVALPSTYAFLEKVIDELILIYAEAKAPLTTIHLGGDEVPEGTWQKSPACNLLIAENPEVNSTDDLWYYYINNVDQILKKRNLNLQGWEEIALRKTLLDGQKHLISNPDFVERDFHLNVWLNGIGWGAEDLPYRLANAGYQVVLSCVSHLYFDLAYEKSPDEPGYYWGGFNDTERPFDFIPFDYYKNTTVNTDGDPVDSTLFIGKDRLTDFGKSNILGIQGQSWAENVRDTARLEYMILPKLLALAERAWAADPRWAIEKNKAESRKLYNESWSVFVNTLGKKELPRLNNIYGGLNYRIPPVGAIVEKGKVHTNIQIPGFIIRYTSDGTEPTVKSKIYTSPITEKGEIRLSAFAKTGRKGRTTSIQNK